MTEVRYADEALRAELLELEERRRRALIEVDIAALDEMFDEQLVHIHAPGLVHTKAQLLEHVATRTPYIDSTRGELTIRVLGDIAIMTGPLVNKLRSPGAPDRTVGGVVTQVVRRCDDGTWRFLSFQMTPNGEHVWPATESELASNPQISQPQETEEPS